MNKRSSTLKNLNGCESCDFSSPLSCRIVIVETGSGGWVKGILFGNLAGEG